MPRRESVVVSQRVSDVPSAPRRCSPAPRASTPTATVGDTAKECARGTNDDGRRERLLAAGDGDGGHPLARLVARRTKTVRTLLGSIEVTRGYYHCGVCKHGFAPPDDRLGITGTSLSPGLGRAGVRAGRGRDAV
jgi:hypothetical protein